MIKRKTNDKHCRGCRGKGSSMECWWECKLVKQLWKPIWGLIKKLKTDPPLTRLYHSMVFALKPSSVYH